MVNNLKYLIKLKYKKNEINFNFEYCILNYINIT